MISTRSWKDKIDAARANIKNLISNEVNVNPIAITEHEIKISAFLKDKNYDEAYNKADQTLSETTGIEKDIPPAIKEAAIKLTKLYQIYIYLNEIIPLHDEEKHVEPTVMTQHFLALVESLPPQTERAFQLLESYRMFMQPDNFEMDPLNAKTNYVRRLQWECDKVEKASNQLERDLELEVKKLNDIAHTLGFSQNYQHLTTLFYSSALEKYKEDKDYEKLTTFFNVFKEEYLEKQLKNQAAIAVVESSPSHNIRVQDCIDAINRLNSQRLFYKVKHLHFKNEIARLEDKPIVLSIPQGKAKIKPSFPLDEALKKEIINIKDFLISIPDKLFYDDNIEIKEQNSGISIFKKLALKLALLEKYEKELSVLHLKDAIEIGHIDYVLYRLKKGDASPQLLFNCLPSTRLDEGELSGEEDIVADILAVENLLEIAKRERDTYKKWQGKEKGQHRLEEKQQKELQRLRLEEEKTDLQQVEDKTQLTNFFITSSTIPEIIERTESFLKYHVLRIKNNSPNMSEYKDEYTDKINTYLEEWRCASDTKGIAGNFFRFHMELKNHLFPISNEDDKTLLADALETLKQLRLLKIETFPGFFLAVKSGSLKLGDNFFYENAKARLNEIKTLVDLTRRTVRVEQHHHHQAIRVVPSPITKPTVPSSLVGTVKSTSLPEPTIKSMWSKVALGLCLFGLANLWNPLGLPAFLTGFAAGACLFTGIVLSHLCLSNSRNKKKNHFGGRRIEIVEDEGTCDIELVTPRTPMMTPHAGNTTSMVRAFGSQSSTPLSGHIEDDIDLKRAPESPVRSSLLTSNVALPMTDETDIPNFTRVSTLQ